MKRISGSAVWLLLGLVAPSVSVLAESGPLPSPLPLSQKTCRGTPHDVDACTAVIDAAQMTPDALPGALADRGLAYLRRNDPDRAIADFEAAIQLKLDYPEAFNDRGFALAEKGRFDQAIADYDEALRLKPAFPAALDNRGRAYIGKGMRDRAIEDYDHSLRLRPSARGFFDRGRAYAAAGKSARAVEDYDQAIGLDDQYSNAFNARGEAHFTLGQIDRAIEDYDRAVQIVPGYVAALANRAYAHIGRREHDLAIRDSDLALLANPKSAWVFNLRGLAYAGKGEMDHAIEDYDQALRLDPGYGVAWNNRGLALAAQSQWERAIGDYGHAIALQPDFASAFNARGMAFSAIGEPARAIQDYKQALQLSPNFAYALSNRGVAHAALEAWPEAIDDFTQAIAASPHYPFAFGQRARAYAALADFDHAISDYDEAIRQFPGYADAIAGRQQAELTKFGPPVLLLLTVVFTSLLGWSSARNLSQYRVRGWTPMRPRLARMPSRSLRCRSIDRFAAHPPPRGSVPATTWRPLAPAMPAQSAHRAVSARAGIAILGSTVAASLLVCAGIVTAANSVPVFVWSFDANLAQGAPDLLAMAQRNPDLHRAMVERRAHAYAAGGWDQANVALSTFLERKFAVYADDAALRSLASAHVDALTYLQGDPARCKSVGLAPRIDREGEPAPAMTAMIRAAWAAIRSGANAQQAGATMTAPTPATDWAMLRNGHNPPSLEEVAVLTSNSGAEPALYCRAAIKVLDNIFYLPADDIARVYRLFLLHADEGNWVADVERSRPK